MSLSLGEQVQNFHADTTQGSIDFYQWADTGWVLFVSHPHQFRPVCATELAALARMAERFAKRNVKILVLSIDPLATFDQWRADIKATQGVDFDLPVIIDSDTRIARMYGMIQPGMSETVPMRAAYIIGPDMRLRASMITPSSLGRNFDELLRMVDSLQLTDRHQVATPSGWKNGDKVIIVPGMSDEDARKRFPDGWDEKRPYLRVVRQPGSPRAASRGTIGKKG